jgi:PP-loop superfamily ATP-utilizing enzyme
VRHHDELARIDSTRRMIDYWLEPANSRAIVEAVRAAGFDRVAIDLRVSALGHSTSSMEWWPA